MALLTATAAFAAAGCGGDDEEAPAGGAPAATEEPAADAPAATEEPQGGTSSESASAGRDLFIQSCGSCHTLADAGTNGAVGPNLDDLAPDRERVLAAIASGPGAMPENLYEGAEAEAVAEYVSSVAGA